MVTLAICFTGHSTGFGLCPVMIMHDDADDDIDDDVEDEVTAYDASTVVGAVEIGEVLVGWCIGCLAVECW